MADDDSTRDGFVDMVSGVRCIGMKADTEEAISGRRMET